MSNNHEINLFQIIKKSFLFFKSYLRKNFLILALLIITGVIIGYFLTIINQTYTTKAIIIPNFETIDYLQNDVELINAKIKEGNLNFLKENKINPSIKHIQITPIVNIYQFINDSDNKRFELLKLFAEDGDINSVSYDEKISKNYKTQQLIITSNSNTISSNDLNSILIFLNKNKFYKEIQEVSIKNFKRKIALNNETINQINLILSNYNTEKNDNSKLLYFNNNLQLNDLIVSKNELIKENDKLSIKLIESDNIIKKISESLNIKSTNVSYKYCLIIPFVFLIIFFSYQLIFKKNN